MALPAATYPWSVGSCKPPVAVRPACLSLPREQKSISLAILQLRNLAILKKWRLRSDSNRRDTASGAANRATHGCIWPLCHGDDNNFQLMYFSRNLAISLSEKSSPRTSRGAKEERQRQVRKQVSIYRAKRSFFQNEFLKTQVKYFTNPYLWPKSIIFFILVLSSNSIFLSSKKRRHLRKIFQKNFVLPIW